MYLNVNGIGIGVFHHDYNGVDEDDDDFHNDTRINENFHDLKC